jgi:hypothetical protein
MGGSQRAVPCNSLSKVAFILGAVLLLFAPPTARPIGAAEFYLIGFASVAMASSDMLVR